MHTHRYREVERFFIHIWKKELGRLRARFGARTPGWPRTKELARTVPKGHKKTQKICRRYYINPYIVVYSIQLSHNDYMGGDKANLDKSTLQPPDTTEIAKESGIPDEKRLGIKREFLWGLWNLGLFWAEVERDRSHFPVDADYVFPGMKGGGVPIATEGVVGFVDQHVGLVLETLFATYLARIPVELMARLYESVTNKKVDPRVSVGISLLVGMLGVSAAEMDVVNLGLHNPNIVGNVTDIWDLFGPLVAGVWAGGGKLMIDYLTQPREGRVFDKFYESLQSKLSQTGKLKEKFGEWGAGLCESGKQYIELMGKNIPDPFKALDITKEYFLSEGHVAALMLKDWGEKQVSRFSRVKNGDIDNEG